MLPKKSEYLHKNRALIRLEHMCWGARSTVLYWVIQKIYYVTWFWNLLRDSLTRLRYDFNGLGIFKSCFPQTTPLCSFLVIELFLGVRKQMKVINAFRFYVYRVISILKCNNLQSLKTILKKGAFCETKQNSVNLIWSADFWSIVLLQIRRDFSQLRL